MKETNCKAERQEIERKIAGAGKVGSIKERKCERNVQGRKDKGNEGINRLGRMEEEKMKVKGEKDIEEMTQTRQVGRW